jgi:hypothetical protein
MHPVLELFTILDVNFEGRPLAKIQLRVKQLTCLFLMSTSMLLGFSFLPSARAGMTIFSISPANGIVGTQVQLTANLTTANGGYNITFEGVVQVVGKASGNDVNASFIVPEAVAGNRTVAVVDVEANESVTGVFTVSTAYTLDVNVPQAPRQLQEGDSVPILVNVTGGDSNSAVVANITVQTPANTTYSEQLGISTSALGSGNATLVYPGNFSGANTNYVGDYGISLNLSVATKSFFVGLTNSTQYHRMEAVNIKAIYAQNETVTLTVSGKDIFGKDIQDPVNVTADSAGLVDYSNWTVPVNASVGTYNVSIVSVSGPTVKVPSDIQNFTVPGFAFNVTARNLAGDQVPNVDVRAFENGTSINNQTTSSIGLAVLMLEIGDYNLQGYYSGVKVGEGNFSVTDTEEVDLVLNLTNLNIRVVGVVNGVEIGIPEVGIYLTQEGVTLATDLTGNAVAYSLLPNAAYNLTASRYNTPFNVTAIKNLLEVNGSLMKVFDVNITCPSFTLKVNAFKAGGQPFDNAAVEVKELLGGIHYDGNTDSNGTITFNAIFGRYDVEIHDSSGMELNSTTVDLFQDQNVTLYCNLFGLNISVTVTDYFGQPFANTNITLQGNGSQPISKRTQANGMVTFDNLVGDSFSISVYLSDDGPPTVVQSLLVQGNATVLVKISKYVLLAGLLVETSQLAIAVIIIASLLLVLSLEVYRRRRNKSQKVDS